MKVKTVQADQVEAMFTGADGSFSFARWGRPIVPVVFGVDEAALPVIKGAIEAVVQVAGHEMAETDPELGANLMLFFIRDWDELLDVPKLAGMLPNISGLVTRLQAGDASQYRTFRKDEAGAIKACFAFVRLIGDMAAQPAEALALGQAALAVLTWSDTAFHSQSPLAVLPESGDAVLRPEIAGLIRAAYTGILPAATNDATHALRLAARL